MKQNSVHSAAVTVLKLPRPALQFKEYLERAEYVKSLLDGQQPAEPSANGATGQKMKPGAGGGDKDVSSSRHESSRAEWFACMIGFILCSESASARQAGLMLLLRAAE